jgi:hypothetical protein
VGSGGAAIVIDAPNVNVTLRNLKILYFSNATYGIHMTDGASLKVEACEIAGFSVSGASGIKFNTPAKVTIVDTIVRDNAVGIHFDNGSTGDVARTTAVGNSSFGIWAHPTVDSTVTVTVTDSVSSSNSFGFIASGDAFRPAKMTISRSTAAHNSSTGFMTYGGGTAVMVVSESVATHNGSFGFSNSSGTFRSLGDNTVFDNGFGDTNGTITVVAGK